MTQQLAVQLESCGKTFANGTCALERINLDVRAGETLALLGPSGCGKTTILRMIAGLEHPDDGGVVRIDGQDVTRLPTERRQVGMVFQHYALFPNMDVAENIGYGLRVQGVETSVRNRRVQELLATVHMTEFAGRPVSRLSGGQKQRVALARALAPSPRVLLLDEPLTALDTQLREALRAELSEVLARLRITTVLVTHDQVEAMALATRIAVMSRGCLEQIGTPEEVYETPKNAFVARFVGAMGSVVATEEHQDLTVGGSGEVYYRPHEVRLNASPGGARGVVLTRFFYGSGTRYLVELTDKQRITADVPGASSWSAGNPVFVHLQRYTHLKDTR